MGFSSPRLYRKKTGVYFVRVLLGKSVFPSELRSSLRTKDPSQARRLVAVLNAFIEGVSMPHRPSAFNDFRNTISTWTVGNVSVADDDDQDRLGRFLAELDRRPTWKATFLDILGRTGSCRGNLWMPPARSDPGANCICSSNPGSRCCTSASSVALRQRPGTQESDAAISCTRALQGQRAEE